MLASYCVMKISEWCDPMLIHGATKKHNFLAPSRFGSKITIGPINSINVIAKTEKGLLIFSKIEPNS